MRRTSGASRSPYHAAIRWLLWALLVWALRGSGGYLTLPLRIQADAVEWPRLPSGWMRAVMGLEDLSSLVYLPAVLAAAIAGIRRPARGPAILALACILTLVDAIAIDWYGQIDGYLVEPSAIQTIVIPWLGSPLLVFADAAFPLALLLGACCLRRNVPKATGTDWSRGPAALAARWIALGVAAELLARWWYVLKLAATSALRLRWEPHGSTLALLLATLLCFAASRPRRSVLYSLLRAGLVISFAGWATSCLIQVATSPLARPSNVVAWITNLAGLAAVGGIMLHLSTPAAAVPRGRWCRRCGYCLLGATADRCPECGRERGGLRSSGRG